MTPDQIRKLADDLRTFGRFCEERAEGDPDHAWLGWRIVLVAHRVDAYADDLEAEELAQ